MPIVTESTYGETRADGSKVILPRVVTTVLNTKSNEEYETEAAAQTDIDSPDTDTTSADIQRSVTLQVLQGIAADGAS